MEILRKLKLEQRFQKALEYNAMRYNHFWDLLQEDNPAYDSFVAVGTGIVRANELISKLWHTLRSLRCGVSLLVAQVYCLFCKLVKVDTTDLEEIRDLCQNASVLDSTDYLTQHMGMGDGVVAVSANSRRLGLINQVNGAFCQMTGYTQEELRDHAFEELIPVIYREPHSVAFAAECSALEVGQRRTYDSRQTFILHKSRYIVPVEQQVVEAPSIVNAYGFIARLRPLKQSPRSHAVVHILADTEFNIKHVSSSMNRGPTHE